MGYASKAGRASTSPSSPRAQGVCQRCGVWYKRDTLANQMQWRGAALLPLNIFVCRPCLDVPQEQLRAIVLPADPVPVFWPLVEPFLYDETGNDPAYGQPDGLIQAAVMPYDGATQTAYGVKLSLISVISNGTTTVAVTCRAAHGLSTGGQVSVEGLANVLACGFFSVTVISATAFTYETGTVVPAAALLTDTTNMITALVGLPLGVTTIPQVT